MFKDRSQLVLPLGADAFEAQGGLHVRDAWGLTIQSFDATELAGWHLDAPDQRPNPAAWRQQATPRSNLLLEGAADANI